MMTAWGLKERENPSYTKDFWAKVCGIKKYRLLRMAEMMISRGQIQLVVGGLFTQMEANNGRSE